MDYRIKLNKASKNLFNDPWVWKMALRDAKHNFSRLFLFIASIIIGIAAVVAINAFNSNLQDDIDVQARDLLGADLSVRSNSPFEEELVLAMDSIPGEKATELNLASMAYFMTGTPGTRLIRLVAIEGKFPFYGEVETSPDNAFEKMAQGHYAVIDQNLAQQYDVSSDDSVKIGNLTFKIAGEVTKIPGGGGIQSTFTPSIYINTTALDLAGLIQFGSRVNYRKYFKTENPAAVESAVDHLDPIIKKYGHSYETVERRKKNLGKGLQNLYRFFNLLAFIALILGCIGVASAIYIYVRQKRKTVAVLRCMGASGWQAFNIFFIQTTAMGILGSIIGVMGGVAVQFLLPKLLSNFVPIELTIAIAWKPIFEGLILGVAVAMLFSVLPLISIRFVPPLAVLRPGHEGKRNFSKLRLFIVSGILLFPILFATYQSGDWKTGLIFFAGLMTAFISLTLVAKVLIWAVQRYFPTGRSFVLRQALANLFRPNNQTITLVVVIGLGTFLVATLNLVQDSLLNQVELVGDGNQSNTILFDIQPHQKEGVMKLTQDNGLHVQQVVPMITTRLASVKDKTVKEIQEDTTDAVPNWALRREYRVTYRDTLMPAEKMIKGKVQHLLKDRDGRDSILVTVSEAMSENLDLTLGDSVVFNVQGVPMTTYIGGVRDVEWSKDPPNFIFTFPTGILEKAPQIYVMTTYVEESVAAKYQNELVAAFPNVSMIDLRLVLNTLKDFFDKVSFIIRFMAFFSIATGLIVLAGAVANSKYLRQKENVLLRTIGAVTKQITSMTLIEYGYLGFFAGLTGILLSLLSGWALTYFFFKTVFLPDFIGLLVIWAVIVGLTIVVGWLNTRDVVKSPPLEILRKEV